MSSAAGTTQFLYDGEALSDEYVGGALAHRYVHGMAEGVDDPLLWYDLTAAGYRRGLFTDHPGSVVAVADRYGNPIAINAYDAWGIPNAGNQSRFGYTGQTWLPELGMWHYKARVYSPTLGRFLQTDPVEYEDQVNLYAYVANDPVNHTDPDGQQARPGSPYAGVGEAVGQVGGYFAGIANDLADLAGGIFDEQRGPAWAFGGMPPMLGGGFGSTLSAAGRSTVITAGNEARAAQAAARAREVHRALDPVAQSRRTTAVLETTRGRVVAGGGRDLGRSQCAVLQAGEAVARAPGAHAEVTAIGHARATGAGLQALGTSRPFCPSCQTAIRDSGGRITSPTTAVWPTRRGN